MGVTMEISWIESERRMYRRDVRALTGWGDTWLAEQIRRGTFPAPMVDPGGKRGFWRAASVREALVALNSRAVPLSTTSARSRGRK